MKVEGRHLRGGLKTNRRTDDITPAVVAPQDALKAELPSRFACRDPATGTVDPEVVGVEVVEKIDRHCPGIAPQTPEQLRRFGLDIARQLPRGSPARRFVFQAFVAPARRLLAAGMPRRVRVVAPARTAGGARRRRSPRRRRAPSRRRSSRSDNGESGGGPGRPRRLTFEEYFGAEVERLPASERLRAWQRAYAWRAGMRGGGGR
jgi:hypothetical protein